MGHVIGVCSQKGGVAKTTTTLGLAGALAESGFRVLVVDLDPQGNLTLGLGFQPKHMRATAADVLLNAVPPQEVLLQSRVAGLYVLPANGNLQLAERYLPSRPHYQHVLKQALQSVRQDYDFLLMDCPPSLSVLTTLALTAAEHVLLLTQAEYFSAYALKPMLQMVRSVRERHNPALAYCILLTMFHRRNRAHRIIRSRLEATFGRGLCRTVIETDTKLREAAIAGIPVTQFAPKARSAVQYRQLAQELIAYVQEESKKGLTETA